MPDQRVAVAEQAGGGPQELQLADRRPTDTLTATAANYRGRVRVVTAKPRATAGPNAAASPGMSTHGVRTRAHGSDGGSPPSLNKAILNAGLGALRLATVNAACRTGTTVLAVPAAYSSQECSTCHHTDPRSRKRHAVS